MIRAIAVAFIALQIFWRMLVAFVFLVGFGASGVVCNGAPGPYTVSITRTAANALEAELITAAETACAAQDALAQACGDFEIEDDCEWRCSDFDGMVLPYALTDAALDYFSKRVDRFREQAEADPAHPGMLTCVLSYTANVTSGEGNTYAVALELHYDEVCGPLCGHFLTAHRTVTFDAQANLLSIEGDGTASAAIS